jgi:PAS domain S-box-containing protein
MENMEKNSNKNCPLSSCPKLELERKYFEQLFESAIDGVVMLDPQNRVIRCNAAFTFLFGYTNNEVQGKLINELIVPEGGLENWAMLMQSLSLGGNVLHKAVRRRKDGSTVHVSILAARIEQEGQPVATYGLYRDISYRKATELELQNQRYELEAQNEELRQLNLELLETKGKLMEISKLRANLLASLSHEIRTPLNGIIGFAQLINQLDQVNPEVIPYVKTIEECGNQMLTISNQLLELAQAEANGMNNHKVLF